AADFVVMNESGPPSMVKPRSRADVIFPPQWGELSISVQSFAPPSCRANAVASPLMPPPRMTVLVIGPSHIESTHSSTDLPQHQPGSSAAGLWNLYVLSG